MKRIFKIVVLVISLSLFFSASAKAEDEKLYKSAATEFHGLLEKYEAIPAPQKHVVDEKRRDVVSIDNKRRDEFVEQTKGKWLSLASRFEEIARAYPSGKWTDDSLFCLTVFSRLEPSKKNNQFKKIAITALKKIAYDNPAFKLEKWTIKTFDELVFKDSRTFYERALPGVSFDEQLRASFRLGLALELRKEGKAEEADNMFKDLLNKYSGTRFESLIRAAKNR